MNVETLHAISRNEVPGFENWEMWKLENVEMWKLTIKN